MRMNVKEYIIYTPEGVTIAPNVKCAVENCQVLGCALGENPAEAVDVLLRDNPWILEAGFSRDEFIVRLLA